MSSLQFNSHADSQDVVSEVLKICGATTAVYPLKDIARRVNAALDRFSYLAMISDGTWQFDDSQYSDLPIGTCDLVSSQQDYTFASDVLAVEKVLVKDSSGNWLELKHVDISDVEDADLIWTKPSSNTGTPDSYELFDDTILLDPVPNYSSTGGLKVVFKRAMNKFASTDTSQKLGTPEIFNQYICRYASLPFLIEKNLPQAGGISQQIQIDEIAIKDYFGYRSNTKDLKPKLSANIEETK